MNLKHNVFAISLIFLFTSCGGWNDERKQKILDQCLEEVYDCNCYLKITIESFPNPEDYNLKLADDDKYTEEVEAYYTKIDECLLQ